jgi:REP element-mobilizing transposase RayT
MPVNQALLNVLEDQKPNPSSSQDHPESKDIGNGQSIPSENTERDSVVILEAVKDHPYDVTYTCLLLPRLSSHVLLEDIANQLEITLKQVCATFGWRLEFLSIKPEYMQWTMHVPPTAPTTHFIQVIREQTSQHLITKFPRFKKSDSPVDFWAPGYLIVLGSQHHPPEIIQKYIQQTRQQQGGKLK